MRRYGTFALVLLWPGVLPAQTHEHEMSPTEAVTSGQATFDAIAEVVARLEANPGTDWGRVDIEALRRHLVDMDRVFTQTRVETEDIEGGARYRVTASGPAVTSIRHLARAHAAAVNRGADARMSVESTAAGAVVEVTSVGGDAEAVERIRGLGFAGLLVLDDHHAAHHWRLATGEAAPGH